MMQNLCVSKASTFETHKLNIMNNLLKSAKFLLLFLFGATFVISAQGQQRILVLPELHPLHGRFIEIEEVRVAGKLVELDKPFTADDNWLQSLVVKIRNISGKPLRYIQMDFSLLDAKINDNSIVGFMFTHGILCSDKLNLPCNAKNDCLRLVMPGEEVEMKFKFGLYTRTKALALQKTGISKFNRVRVGIAFVQFEDGTSKMSLDLVPHNST